VRCLGKAGAFACLALLASAASAQTVNVWLTTDDQTTLMQPRQPVAFSSTSSTAPSITISDTDTYQTIEGFGASMTDSAAYLMNEIVPPAALPGVLQSLFDHTNGIGISFLRNPMGASDITRYDYSYDDQPPGAADPSLADFSIAHDQVDIIPMLLAAKAINPQLTMLATPWSPPGWMKTTGSMVGGSLLPAAYTPFANYLVDYLKAYQSAGVPVDYLTLQNEPLNVPADYPGESMPDTDQLTIMKNSVLPALAAANLTTRVLVYDHNWDQPSYPQTVLADPSIASSPQVAGIAWHWYGGTPGAMTTLYNQYPHLGQYVTEASGGTWIADEVKADFETIIQSLRNWAKSYVKWSLALDQNRGPHTGGCGDCSGLITVDENTGAVSNMIDYYTLGHFSKFILPGAVRVWSSNASGIISAAFLNPDHMTRVLVVYNDSSSSETFQVVWNGLAFSYTLPALGGATFEWTAAPTVVGCVGGRGQTASFHFDIPKPCPQYTVPATAQIQASSYTNVSNLETESTADTRGGFDVGYSSDGSWAQYRNVDFGPGVTTVSARVASGGSGGTLEFHLRSPFGALIAQATVPVTGAWQNWTTVTAPVSHVQGLNSIYVVYRATAGANGIANLNWFQFQ
jgi:glucosylceramidase